MINLVCIVISSVLLLLSDTQSTISFLVNTLSFAHFLVRPAEVWPLLSLC